MSPSVELHIDLAFSLSEPGNGGPTERLQGTVTADGTDVAVYASNPSVLVQGQTMNLTIIRGLAAQLAARGLTVSLSGPDGLIARIGDVDAPLVQRLLTKSPNITLGSRAALAPLIRSGAKNVLVTSPPAIPLPPPTLFPLVPTLDRKLRRRVTTTHYAHGGGRPRLIFVVGSENWNGQKPREFDLLPTKTTIGSAPESDLVLAGLKAFHAEIHHDENDEYVLYPLGEVSGSVRMVDGAASTRSGGIILRTGSRVEMGKWRMAFFREEFADHGRPFGGRVGGEFAVQKPQGPRPRRTQG
ncbi:FHA domain-containing protein [Cryobacterium sp. MLB-32]|uniref:FHA domain-containing protein n=1 Tax=Cryobacterium sp. MLB-32 TaxID=1529318 RepID=UPI00055EB8EA|nr:FHA domain-containing protein [Cryobacterium sp. MLB-32]